MKGDMTFQSEFLTNTSLGNIPDYSTMSTMANMTTKMTTDAHDEEEVSFSRRSIYSGFGIAEKKNSKCGKRRKVKIVNPPVKGGGCPERPECPRKDYMKKEKIKQCPFVKVPSPKSSPPPFRKTSGQSSWRMGGATVNYHECCKLSPDTGRMNRQEKTKTRGVVRGNTKRRARSCPVEKRGNKESKLCPSESRDFGNWQIDNSCGLCCVEGRQRPRTRSKCPSRTGLRPPQAPPLGANSCSHVNMTFRNNTWSQAKISDLKTMLQTLNFTEVLKLLDFLKRILRERRSRSVPRCIKCTESCDKDCKSDDDLNGINTKVNRPLSQPRPRSSSLGSCKGQHSKRREKCELRTFLGERDCSANNLESKTTNRTYKSMRRFPANNFTNPSRRFLALSNSDNVHGTTSSTIIGDDLPNSDDDNNNRDKHRQKFQGYNGLMNQRVVAGGSVTEPMVPGSSCRISLDDMECWDKNDSCCEITSPSSPAGTCAIMTTPRSCSSSLFDIYIDSNGTNSSFTKEWCTNKGADYSVTKTQCTNKDIDCSFTNEWPTNKYIDYSFTKDIRDSNKCKQMTLDLKESTYKEAKECTDYDNDNDNDKCKRDDVSTFKTVNLDLGDKSMHLNLPTNEADVSKQLLNINTSTQKLLERADKRLKHLETCLGSRPLTDNNEDKMWKERSHRFKYLEDNTPSEVCGFPSTHPPNQMTHKSDNCYSKIEEKQSSLQKKSPVMLPRSKVPILIKSYKKSQINQSVLETQNASFRTDNKEPMTTRINHLSRQSGIVHHKPSKTYYDKLDLDMTRPDSNKSLTSLDTKMSSSSPMSPTGKSRQKQIKGSGKEIALKYGKYQNDVSKKDSVVTLKQRSSSRRNKGSLYLSTNKQDPNYLSLVVVKSYTACSPLPSRTNSLQVLV